MSKTVIGPRDRLKNLCAIALMALAVTATSGCSHRSSPPAKQAEAPGIFKDPLTGMEFVHVKGGTYDMGDLWGDGFPEENPVHKVTVSDFYIGKCEVSQEQWEKVMGYNNSLFKGPQNPVDKVSWDEIQEFAKKLKELTGVTYRLPTEAEWEYAARSGGKHEKWAGTNNESEVGDYAWYIDNSNQQSHPICTKKPNGLGIHDMSGSLWEWVHDRFDLEYPAGEQVNPKGPEVSWKNDYRTYRGGAWDYIPRIVRTASRSGKEPDYQRQWIGFRLAKDVGGDTPILPAGPTKKP